MSDMERQPETTTPSLYNSGYWKTLEQWTEQNAGVLDSESPDMKSLAETEFMSSPLREDALSEADQDSGFARRDFLKLMGASLAMASAGCIRRPVEKIIPYNKGVEEVTFGVPNYYTSASFDGVESLGLLIKTREGRPIKVCLLYTSPSPRDGLLSRMPSSA